MAACRRDRRRGGGRVWFLVAAVMMSPGPAIGEGATITVAAVGDIMLDGSARPEMVRFGYDHPFAATGDLLRGASIAIGNLEGPLTDGGTPENDKQYLFRSPPGEVAPALARAGFDVVSLANNHILDFGVEGLSHTIEILKQHGIAPVGAGENLAAARRPVILEREGHRIAFLAYSLTFPESFWATRERAGTAFGHAKHIRADVRKAARKADLVLVSFHWGREATTELRDYQTELGRHAIDAGAHAVIGHHPHILQGVERYRDGVILYSIGNFAFGSYSPRSRSSAIAMLTFNGGRLQSARLVPLNVHNADVVFRPTPLSGAAADSVVTELQQLSARHGTVLANDKGTALLEIGAAGAAQHP